MLRRADNEAWRSWLARRNLSRELVSTWSDLARPNIRLIPGETYDEDWTAVSASKLGGLPDLPAIETWPVRAAYEYPEGRRLREYLESVAWGPAPLSFLGQINLADIATNGCDLPLPDSGLLLFFYDMDTEPWGFDPCDAPGTRIMFISAETPVRCRLNPPVEPLPVVPLECVPGECLPSLTCLRKRLVGPTGYSPESFDREMSKLSHEDEALICYGGHAIGGWPDPVQNSMEWECELVTNGIYAGGPGSYASPRAGKLRNNAGDWCLLLQLDSDDDLWMWGMTVCCTFGAVSKTLRRAGSSAVGRCSSAFDDTS